MHLKPCRCGTITKLFKFDVGPFFIGQCCIEAGYDTFGHKEGVEEEPNDATPNIPFHTVTEPKQKRKYQRSGNLKKPEEA